MPKETFYALINKFFCCTLLRKEYNRKLQGAGQPSPEQEQRTQRRENISMSFLCPVLRYNHIGQSQRVCWNVSKTFPKNSNPLSMIITSKCSRLHFSTMIRESFSKVIFVMSSIICIKSGPKKNIKHLHNR